MEIRLDNLRPQRGVSRGVGEALFHSHYDPISSLVPRNLDIHFDILRTQGRVPVSPSRRHSNRHILAPMKSLPLELLRPIVGHLKYDYHALLAVSLASRELRVEGQRILFRRMILPMDKEAQIKFLTAITSSTVLAEYVEEFQQYELVDPAHQEKSEPLWSLTCRGLQAMVNLKYLPFRAAFGRSCAEILRGCTFQLEILRWENYDDAEHLFEFLKSQQKLRVLGFTWSNSEHLELNPSGICPGLQVLHGDQQSIDAFFPGRHISSLRWSADLEELRIGRPIYTPPQEFDYLRYLSLGGFGGRPLLSVVCRCVPVLEVLELVGLYAVEVCLIAFFVVICAAHRLCAQELGWLQEIPMLRIFILSNPYSCTPPLSLEERKEYFPQIFELCNNLQYIDIDIKTEERHYQRWLRDGSPPSEISDDNEVLIPEWNIS